jgi:hypothetical protein
VSMERSLLWVWSPTTTAWAARTHRRPRTIEDAEYVAVTRPQADALVTVDDGCAARAQGLVPLAPLEALSR